MKSYPYTWVALDVVSGLGAAYLIAGNAVFSLSILAAILGGNMPDVLHAYWSMISERQKQQAPKFIHAYFDFHEAIQRETDSAPKGIVSQILTGGLAILITRILI